MKAKHTSTSHDVPPEPAPDLSGETFGDFRLVRRLGLGGMGQVYLADQISLSRKVAIKVLREDIAANAVARERFEEESRTIAQLSHANVVQVYTIGEHEGRAYMALEYVEGKSLGEYMAKQGKLEVPLVLSLMRQVATALERAGELGIVHRDIKPANIMLTRKAQAKVTDFGLARCLDAERVDLTRDGTTVGTPLYMSPEQIEGKPVDGRSDIYSFGVTCFHMLAGRPPFEGSGAFEVAIKHAKEPPPPLEKYRRDVPPELAALVGKMMAKKPRDRHQTAKELLEDISRVRALIGGASRSVTLASDTQTADLDDDTSDSVPVPAWKRPVYLLAGAAALVALIVVAGAVAAILSLPHGGARVAIDKPGVTPQPPEAEKATELLEREKTLRAVVDRHLAEPKPNPSGIDDCIELAVIYLDQQRVEEAKKLFDRMDNRKAPSAYFYVGRLGLAVTDAIEKKSSESHKKFAYLFDAKAKDNRVQVLNDYLTKHPEFAKWVNEADGHNSRNGSMESHVPPKFRGGKLPFGKNPFKK